jgi:CheY-like chemotaxis protein
MLVLPAIGKEPVVQQPEKYLIMGSGRVLFMDDEEMVRDLAGAALDALGYEAVLAGDGREAVALYEEAMKAGKPIAVVIMDLTVPGGVGGEEALQSLLRLDPQVKAVVSSGYAQDPIMAKYAEYGFCAVLAKPYSITMLGELLHAVLSGQGNQQAVSPS